MKYIPGLLIILFTLSLPPIVCAQSAYSHTALQKEVVAGSSNTSPTPSEIGQIPPTITVTGRLQRNGTSYDLI